MVLAKKRKDGLDATDNSWIQETQGRIQGQAGWGAWGFLRRSTCGAVGEQGADWGALKRSSVLIGDAEAAVAEKVVVVRRSEGDGKEEERGRRNHEGDEDEVRGNKQRAAGFRAGERIWPVRVALAGRMTG